MTTNAMPISIACPSRPFRRPSLSTFSRTRGKLAPARMYRSFARSSRRARSRACRGRSPSRPSTRASSRSVALVVISAWRPAALTARTMSRIRGWAVGSPKPPNMTDSRWGKRRSCPARRSKTSMSMLPMGSSQVLRIQVRHDRLQREVGSMVRRLRLWMLGRISKRPWSETTSRRAPGERPSFFSSSGGTTSFPASVSRG